MEYKDAISMLFERSGATQTFWNFHFTIILALIAFFASISPNPKLTLLKYFVIVRSASPLRSPTQRLLRPFGCS